MYISSLRSYMPGAWYLWYTKIQRWFSFSIFEKKKHRRLKSSNKRFRVFELHVVAASRVQLGLVRMVTLFSDELQMGFHVLVRSNMS